MPTQRYGHPTTYSGDPSQHSDPHSRLQGPHDPSRSDASGSAARQEPPVPKEEETRRKNGLYEPATKRQKLSHAQPQFQFVSQTKWKFSDTQPWPEVQQPASTNAKNAAGIRDESAAHVMVETQPRPIRQKLRSVDEGVRTKKDSATISDRRPPALSKTREVKTAADSTEGSQSNETTRDSLTSVIRGQLAAPQQKQNPTKGASPKRTTKYGVGFSGPQHSPHTPVAQMDTCPMALGGDPLVASIPVGPVQVIPRTKSLSKFGLSLEKDGDQIAALIAEKRKENESSMFRQRMLQMQLQHQSQKAVHNQPDLVKGPCNIEPRIIVTDEPDRFTRQTPQNILPTTHPSLGQQIATPPVLPIDQLRSESSRHDGLTDSSKNHRAAETTQAAHPRQPRSASTMVARKALDTANRTVTGRKNKGTCVVQDVGKEQEQVRSYTMQSNGANTTLSDTPTKFTPADERVQNPSTKARSGRFSAEVSNNIISESTSAGDQLIEKSVQDVCSSSKNASITESRGPNAHARPSQRVPSTHRSSTQQPGSAPNLQAVNPMTSVVRDTIVAPAPFCYKSSPRSHIQTKYPHTHPATVHQRSVQHMGPPMQPSRVQQTRNLSNTPTFYNIHQNFYLGSSHITSSHSNGFVPPSTLSLRNFGDSNSHTSMHNVSPPASTNIAGYMPSHPSTSHMFMQAQIPTHIHVQGNARDLPQPPVLSSNVSMIHGQTRVLNTAVHGSRPETVRKERVNMFMSRNGVQGMGNAGGNVNVMGMEDVRRQIEMT